MKRLVLLTTLCVLGLLLFTGQASALSLSTAKRAALPFAPVKNPTIYDTSSRETKRQGSRTLWVHYVAPGTEPTKFAPDSLDQKPQLGFGFLVNGKREFIIDYYVAGQRVFNSGGSLDNPAAWALTRNDQPIDQKNDVYFDNYWQGINQLSVALNIPLVPNLPGDKLRWFANAFYYQVKGSSLYLYTYTGNLDNAFVEPVKPEGSQTLAMTKSARVLFPAWRSPGLQQWRTRVSIGKKALWSRQNVEFRFGGCNQFGCTRAGSDKDSRPRFLWRPNSKTVERLTP